MKQSVLKTLRDNYSLEPDKIELTDSHFGTNIYSLEASGARYIVKTLPLFVSGVENEGYITEFLLNNGIKVARLLRTKAGAYHVKTDDMQLHVQEFIEGETLRVNTAPDWFLEKSAGIIGKVHQILRGFDELATCFDAAFFSASAAEGAVNRYSDSLGKAKQLNDKLLSAEIKERIRHLSRIAKFDIDAKKLTYVNSHGDYHIGQIIVSNNDLTVIDWTSACKLPAALEIMTSYVTADPSCKSGEISGDGLKRYIDDYLKFSSLSDYDIQMMPYILYFQQILCHYPPPYSDVEQAYKPMCALINGFTNWLYDNVDTLSVILSSV